MSVLVTGSAGFIGYHVAASLLARGERVVGLDDLNPYYDPALKRARLARLLPHPNFRFHAGSICDAAFLDHAVAADREIDRVVHLAAQAGVRRSLEDPGLYVRSNVLGHVLLLEAVRRLPRIAHVAYASSSSVYGLNDSLPFAENDPVDRPNSIYAATKRSGELMAHAYGHLYAMPQTGLRFFTVYGPWGRPDMAYYDFALAIAAGRPLTLYEGTDLSRDFTYVDDVVDGVLRALDHPPPAAAPTRLLNLGNHRREPVTRLIALLEQALGRRAVIRISPRPAADLPATYASIDAARDQLGWQPRTTLDQGIPRFVDWLRGHHELPGRGPSPDAAVTVL